MLPQCLISKGRYSYAPDAKRLTSSSWQNVPTSSVCSNCLSLCWLGRGPGCAAVPAELGHLAVEALKVVLPGHHDAVTPWTCKREASLSLLSRTPLRRRLEPCVHCGVWRGCYGSERRLEGMETGQKDQVPCVCAGTQFETGTDLVMEINTRLLFHYLSTRISESLMNSLLSFRIPLLH